MGFAWLLAAPCACCSPGTRQRGWRVLAVAALVPGIAALLALGVGSLAALLLRMVVGPFVLVAVQLATQHLYPTSLGRVHLVFYR
jgi:hypothetical protein